MNRNSVKITRLKHSFIFLFVSLSFFSCTTTQSDLTFTQYDESSLLPAKITWQNLNDNLGYFSFIDESIPLIYHCIKINLGTPDLTIKTFPSSEKDLTKSLFPKEFAKKTDSLISINTSPFKKTFFSSAEIVGIHKTDNTILSKPVNRYSALVFLKKPNGYSAGILENQIEKKIDEFDYAFGGFFSILNDGNIKQFSYKSRNSRTAVGVDKEGKTLFILVVEGENKRKSTGLSYPESAIILKKIGAVNAMQMDGGNSSSLYVNKKNFLSYKKFTRQPAFLGFSFCNRDE